MTERRRAVFLGSGAFAVPVLDALSESDRVRIEAVLTAPPRPAGRSGTVTRTPVHERAEALGLPVRTPTRLADPAAVTELAALAPNVLVLADYGRLVPPAVLDLVGGAALNLHPSLLPRHRGASPIPASILAGDAVTGVTLMGMDAGLDTGPILASVTTPIGPDEHAPALEGRLASLAADLLREHLPIWLDGGLSAVPQGEAGATMTRPLRRADGRLDPTRPADELARMVRAYDPWPGTWFESSAGRIAVLAGSPMSDIKGGGASSPGQASDGTADGHTLLADPGTLVADGGGLALRCGDGWLRLDRVRPAGGTAMTGAALRRGRPGLVGSRVGEASLG